MKNINLSAFVLLCLVGLPLFANSDIDSQQILATKLVHLLNLKNNFSEYYYSIEIDSIIKKEDSSYIENGKRNWQRDVLLLNAIKMQILSDSSIEKELIKQYSLFDKKYLNDLIAFFSSESGQAYWKSSGLLASFAKSTFTSYFKKIIPNTIKNLKIKEIKYK